MYLPAGTTTKIKWRDTFLARGVGSRERRNEKKKKTLLSSLSNPNPPAHPPHTHAAPHPAQSAPHPDGDVHPGPTSQPAHRLLGHRLPKHDSRHVDGRARVATTLLLRRRPRSWRRVGADGIGVRTRGGAAAVGCATAAAARWWGGPLRRRRQPHQRRGQPHWLIFCVYVFGGGFTHKKGGSAASRQGFVTRASHHPLFPSLSLSLHNNLSLTPPTHPPGTAPPPPSPP